MIQNKELYYFNLILFKYLRNKNNSYGLLMLVLTQLLKDFTTVNLALVIHLQEDLMLNHVPVILVSALQEQILHLHLLRFSTYPFGIILIFFVSTIPLIFFNYKINIFTFC